ncbi:PorV/PorQ family protein [bacterium]|nr:PorV/PorQ family protein [bacterium]
MSSKYMKHTLLTAAAALLAMVGSLLGQGIQNREYTGLDKYVTQGRPDNLSFAGVRAAEFLTIPVGARGIGLGDAYTAVADDISAIWYNPAGLGFLQNTQIMGTMVDYTMDLKYSYLCGATPVGDGSVVLGAFFGYLDIGEMKITTVSTPNGDGRVFGAYDFQMGGTVAYTFSDRFTGGLSLKYVHQDVFNNLSGNAFAIDAGGIYHTEFAGREVKLAFAVQNLGTNVTMRGSLLDVSVSPEGRGETGEASIPDGYGDYSNDPLAIMRRTTREGQYKTHTYHLPTVVKMALSYNLYTSGGLNWLATGEINRNSYMPLSYSTGSEVSFNFTEYISAALRLGWKIQTDEYTDDTDNTGIAYNGDDPTFRGFSCGGGIKRNVKGKTLEFNYAYRNKGRLSSDNFFTVAFGF